MKEAVVYFPCFLEAVVQVSFIMFKGYNTDSASFVFPFFGILENLSAESSFNLFQFFMITSSCSFIHFRAAPSALNSSDVILDVVAQNLKVCRILGSAVMREGVELFMREVACAVRWVDGLFYGSILRGFDCILVPGCSSISELPSFSYLPDGDSGHNHTYYIYNDSISGEAGGELVTHGGP